jgi:hypothetical protein
MREVARETGGEPFYGTNDVAFAMSQAVRQGTHYYALAYVPSNGRKDGHHNIEVKIARKDVKLSYRRGYYVNSDKELSGEQATLMLAKAMLPIVPISTMLPLRAKVILPDTEHKAITVDYIIDAHDLTFAEGPEGQKQTMVDFMVTAWDKNYKDAGHLSDTAELTLGAEAYLKLLQTGLPLHQELELKPGAYTLRLGIIDRGSQKIGTMDVPLTIGGNETVVK